ncbi:MAG TPA: hypothetical protein VIV11_18480 [Kofleriaceae bacterium]
MRWALLLLMATGCRQLFGLDSPDPMRDAAGDGQGIDGPRDAQGGTCVDRWKAGPQFAAPLPLTSLNSTQTNERMPFLANDNELYLVRDNDLYVATASPMGGFSDPMRVDSLSSMASEDRVFVNKEGTRAFLSSNRGGGTGGVDLWRGHRAGPIDTWGVDQMYLENLNRAGDQTNPHLSDALLQIYYGYRGTGLMVAERASVSQSFGNGAPISELNHASGEDDAPSLTGDATVIVFESRRTGNWELWYSTRDGIGNVFSPPLLIPGLNVSTRSDNGPHITRDGCTLYFASDRNGGSFDLFMATLLD